MARSCLRALMDRSVFTSKVSYPSLTTVRKYRYNKKGGMKPHRINPHWREVDHNPANIPKDWVPDSWKEQSVIDYEREKELQQYIPGYESILPDREHPHYHEEPIYHFSPDTKLVDGLKQSLCLTKSVLFEELPQQIQELSENISIPKQDDRVIQVFRRALLFDLDPKTIERTYREKQLLIEDLRISPVVDRYCPGIIENLIRLCQTQAHLFPGLQNRIQARNITTSTYFRRICDLSLESASDLGRDWLVSILSSGGLQLLAETELKPFANEDEIKKTETMNMPDIFPVFPIVDLEKTQIYQTINSTGLQPGFTHSHFHTLVLQNTIGRTPEEIYAQMTSQLFACLQSRACKEFGNAPIDLPRPFMGQCIASDGQNYQFMCMQLNTTKLDCDTGTKNMVWISDRKSIKEDVLEGNIRENYSSIPMFKECSHRAWRSPEYYTDYDPTVFQTFLAMWLNGAT